MDVATEIARFDPEVPIERAWMPPASWYTAPEFDALEREHVLGASWQPVARREQLREVGDFVSGVLAGEPWVIVRSAAGLRAFHNTCRHKGREVVQGCGHAEQLVCGYHAWRYDLEGQLVSAPQIAGIQEFDRREMSLPTIALEEWGPWVWLHSGGAAGSLKGGVQELDRRLEETGWGELRFVEATTWTIGCNWKVYVDNYLDGGYHIPHMHPTLDAQLDMSTYRTELFDGYSIQSSGTSSTDDRRIAFDAVERIGGGALYAWLFPNFMLNRYGPCLDTNWVVPLGPERCQVHYEFFFAPELLGEGDPDELIRESIEQSAVTQQEDISICESVQLGLRSRGYDRGRYAPRLEVGEHQFHGLLARRLRAALLGS